jgi:hypothetical protein
MEPENPQPLSLFKVATVDYPGWISFVAPLVVWTFCILVLVAKMKAFDIAILWKVGLVLTLIGAAVLALRYFAIRSHFQRGVEVPGKIIRMANVQDIGRVIYSYTYLTKSFQNTNFFHFSMRMDRLEEQRDVVVVLDPANPHRAMIKNFYFEVEGDEEE